MTLDECFAMRGQYCNLQALDEDEQAVVLAHFAECQACQEWARKHKLVVEIAEK